MTTRDLLLSAWTWRPGVLAACAMAVAAYALLWQRASHTVRSRPHTGPSAAAGSNDSSISGRSDDVHFGDPRSRLGSLCAFDSRVSAFLGASPRKLVFLLLAALVFLLTLASPLDQLAEGYLFSAHMLQHLLLLLVVPALLVLALPNAPSRSRPGPPVLARTLLGWVAGVGAMWLWHVPALCDAAAISQGVRAFQTLSLIVLGGLFWWPIIGPGSAHRLAPLVGVGYLFTACTACTLLGILITFAPVSVCPVYLQPVDHLDLLPLLRDRWGLTATVDQQIGGLLMWVPACFIYLSAILGLLWRWYNHDAVTAPEQASAGQLR